MLQGKLERRGLKVHRQFVEMLEPRVLMANVGMDPAFGANGLVIFGAANQLDVGLSITLQNDNKIVVGGFNQVPAERHARLTRLLPNGAFDPLFGTAGSSELPGMQNPWSLAISADGSIIAAGDGHNGQIIGAINSTSGSGQFQWGQTISVGSSETFYDVKIQSSGRIIAVGRANGGAATLFAAVQPNGSFDSSYKNGGAFLEDLDGSSIANVEAGYVVIPRADGGYLAVGAGWNDNTSDRLITVRHLANGQPDESYGVHGVTALTTPAFTGQIGDAKVLSDGSFFVSSAYNILVKFTPQGQIDPVFGIRDIPRGQRQEIRPLANGKVAVVTFADPVSVTVFDEFGNLLDQQQSVPLSPSHFIEVDDGIIQADGKVLVTGRWAPAGCSVNCSDWQLTTEEYAARTQAFSILAVPEPATILVGAMVAINLLARRLKRTLHHQRGGNCLRRSRSCPRATED